MSDLAPAAEHTRLEREAAACKAAADIVAEAVALLTRAKAIEDLPRVDERSIGAVRDSVDVLLRDVRCSEFRAASGAKRLCREAKRRVA
jgi:hypothetical protein